MDEVIDDLISLESGFNDGGLDCMEPNIIMQNNVSMNHINYSHILILFKMWQTITSLKVFCIDFCDIISFVKLLTLLQLGFCQVKFLN